MFYRDSVVEALQLDQLQVSEIVGVPVEIQIVEELHENNQQERIAVETVLVDVLDDFVVVGDVFEHVLVGYVEQPLGVFVPFFVFTHFLVEAKVKFAFGVENDDALGFIVGGYGQRRVVELSCVEGFERGFGGDGGVVCLHC